tara:strand:- start:2108 stop:2770 length:663 start_codon:yes stop_codon:yes gene_type:complete
MAVRKVTDQTTLRPKTGFKSGKPRPFNKRQRLKLTGKKTKSKPIKEEEDLTIDKLPTKPLKQIKRTPIDRSLQGKPGKPIKQIVDRSDEYKMVKNPFYKGGMEKYKQYDDYTSSKGLKSTDDKSFEKYKSTTKADYKGLKDFDSKLENYMVDQINRESFKQLDNAADFRYNKPPKMISQSDLDKYNFKNKSTLQLASKNNGEGMVNTKTMKSAANFFGKK